MDQNKIELKNAIYKMSVEEEENSKEMKGMRIQTKTIKVDDQLKVQKVSRDSLFLCDNLDS